MQHCIKGLPCRVAYFLSKYAVSALCFPTGLQLFTSTDRGKLQCCRRPKRRPPHLFIHHMWQDLKWGIPQMTTHPLLYSVLSTSDPKKGGLKWLCNPPPHTSTATTHVVPLHRTLCMEATSPASLQIAPFQVPPQN